MSAQNWPLLPLHELPIQIVDGDRSAKYPKRYEFQTDGVVFLNSTNIVDNRLSLSECNRIPEEKYEVISKGRTRDLDIVMTTRGSIGKVALVKQRILHRGLINAQMLLMRADAKTVDPTFFFYVTCSDKFQGELRNFASGSAQPQIPIADLRQVSIPAPPLPTQRKIATILSAYDDLIEINMRRIKILEEMAQNIYREWLIKFRFPGYKNACFTDSLLGMIPEGWGVKRLGQLADSIRDSVNPASVDPETPYFGLEHLPKKSITLSDWGTVSDVQSTKLLFKRGDILFGKIRPYFHKVGVAPLSGVCSSDTIVIRPRSIDWFGLVLGCTSSDEFVEHATATSHGTKMPRANWDVLAKYELPVPLQPILGQFNEFMSEIVNQLHNFVFRNKSLCRTRDLLLPKLISGEVDVSELNIIMLEEVNA